MPPSHPRGPSGVACVVIHPRKAAAAAIEGASARFAGPFVQNPKISTGAGDHFNAGFCLGRIIGLGLEESLCAGVACSGYYVRSAASPTAAESSPASSPSCRRRRPESDAGMIGANLG